MTSPSKTALSRRQEVSSSELVLLGSAIGITGCALVLAVARPALWARLGREDGAVEIAGVAAFLILAIVAAKRLIQSPTGARVPSLAAVLLGIVGAGEEISWGQRLFDLEPPPFFTAHNVQGEMNLHNLLPPPWDSGLAGLLLLGFCLSPLWRDRGWARWLLRRGLPWPRSRHVGVLLGCLAAGVAVGLITNVGELEEVGELFFVLIVAAVWSGSQS